MTDIPPLNERIASVAGQIARLVREGPKPGTTTEDFLRELGLVMHHWSFEVRQMQFTLDGRIGRPPPRLRPKAPRNSIEAVSAVMSDFNRVLREHGERR